MFIINNLPCIESYNSTAVLLSLCSTMPYTTQRPVIVRLNHKSYLNPIIHPQALYHPDTVIIINRATQALTQRKPANNITGEKEGWEVMHYFIKGAKFSLYRLGLLISAAVYI